MLNEKPALSILITGQTPDGEEYVGIWESPVKLAFAKRGDVRVDLTLTILLDHARAVLGTDGPANRVGLWLELVEPHDSNPFFLALSGPRLAEVAEVLRCFQEGESIGGVISRRHREYMERLAGERIRLSWER
jgi:hypothetical protein